MPVDLSIVTTLYFSAPYLREFHGRATRAAQALTDSYEIIYVNDGTPDDALDIALDLMQGDPHVVVVDLSRNFGHHRALMTGVAQAAGARIFLIDSDLEEAPEILLDLDARFRSEPCDVVYGVQSHRKGGWFERTSGEAFYRVFNWLSSAPTPRNIVVARLMSRRYVTALLQFGEHVSWMDGLFTLAGFRQVPVPVAKGHKGRSTYTLARKLALAVESITDFSDVPLRLIFYAGLLISAISAGYIGYLVVRKLVFDIPVDGWTSVIVSIWFLGGMTILFLGVIGIYLSKVFIETKRRPLTIVRHVYRHDQQAGN